MKTVQIDRRGGRDEFLHFKAVTVMGWTSTRAIMQIAAMSEPLPYASFLSHNKPHQDQSELNVYH